MLLSSQVGCEISDSTVGISVTESVAQSLSPLSLVTESLSPLTESLSHHVF